jgi:hypothetical protein
LGILADHTNLRFDGRTIRVDKASERGSGGGGGGGYSGGGGRGMLSPIDRFHSESEQKLIPNTNLQAATVVAATAAVAVDTAVAKVVAKVVATAAAKVAAATVAVSQRGGLTSWISLIKILRLQLWRRRRRWWQLAPGRRRWRLRRSATGRLPRRRW